MSISGYIVKVERLGIKMREGRLRCYRYLMRRGQEYVERRVMEMELREKRKRRWSKRRFVDVVKEDMGEVCARENHIENRTLWRNIIRCGNP